RHLHGRFSLFHKLKFLWIKKTKPCSKFVGLVFGVVPEWQGKGIDSYMIVEGCRIIQSMDLTNGKYEVGDTIYDNYEMQWIGEFNPKMINVAEALGTYRSRQLTTYRYLFDRSLPFEPHPILQVASKSYAYLQHQVAYGCTVHFIAQHIVSWIKDQGISHHILDVGTNIIGYPHLQARRIGPRFSNGKPGRDTLIEAHTGIAVDFKSR